MFLKIEINLDKPIYTDKEHIESNAILKKKNITQMRIIVQYAKILLYK